jgi:hypothetical protein
MALQIKTAFAAFAINAYIAGVDAADFTRSAAFESVEAFVAAATAFQPSAAKTDLSPLFTIRELGQPEDPKTGAPVSAASIRSAAPLWSDASHALVFVTATPPTDATHSAVGVLFLLHRSKQLWRIADLQRFTATGKYADVSAELTAGTGVGYQLGSEGMMPVVTIREAQGGRGYGYQISASYTFRASKLSRINPE